MLTTLRIAAKIRRVAIYSYSEQQIKRAVKSTERIRLWYCFFAVAGLIGLGIIEVHSPNWLPRISEGLRTWLSALTFAIFIAPLSHILLNWKGAGAKLEKSLKGTNVEVFPDGVSVSYGLGFVRRIERREIWLAEEPAVGTGLYLRTPNRYRWILIPRKIEGYETIKCDLEKNGISLVRTSIPPNLEEFLGVFLFIGTIICAFTAHRSRVLGANLLISFIVSLAGLWVINSNPDNFPRMRWLRFGAFLPVAFAALQLWFSMRS